MEKVIKTKSAEIKFHKDGLVEKQTYKIDNAIIEIDRLLKLRCLFNGIEINGWEYKFVEIVGYDLSKGILMMKKAPGKTFDEIMKKHPELLYHMGVWLAEYHNSALIDGKFELYNDYNRNNVLIDLEKKIVTAIDPGGDYSNEKLKYPEIDVLVGMYSIGIGAFKNRINMSKAIEFYFKGYVKHYKRQVNAKNIEEAYLYLQDRYKNKHKNQFFLLRGVFLLQQKLYYKKLFRICLKLIKQFDVNA